MSKSGKLLEILEATEYSRASYEARIWLQDFAQRGGNITYELQCCHEVGITLADVFDVACSDLTLYNDPHLAFLVARKLQLLERGCR